MRMQRPTTTVNLERPSGASNGMAPVKSKVHHQGMAMLGLPQGSDSCAHACVEMQIVQLSAHLILLQLPQGLADICEGHYMSIALDRRSRDR